VAGATIDHMISLTILIAALLVAMTTYNGMFATAVDYDRNRQVANKAVDIMNTICLSPGNPVNWGETNASVLGFGLQDPEVGGYVLSPYSIMRLQVSNSSGHDQIVEYPPGSGVFYNNMSGKFGHGIFTPVGDCVDYTNVAELLGINGTYGFRLDLMPTLDVRIEQLDTNPLKLAVEVYGSGLPMSGATLNFHLFHVSDGEGGSPAITTYSDVTQTGPSGAVDIVFSDVTKIGNNDPSYTFTVYVSIGGINGVGYYTHNDLLGDSQYIIPLINNFDDGTVLIAHNWIVDPPAVQYNATFYILTSDFQLIPVPLDYNSTGLLNFGQGKPYYITEIPDSEVGLLVISYRKSAVEMGNVILPWGVGTLGISTSFGGGINSESSTYRFVATELRQVTISGISYQVKVLTWSLRG